MEDINYKGILEGIVRYLDNTNQLNKLLTVIGELKEKIQSKCENPNLTFYVQIDMSLLTNISGEVADLLLSEPLKSLRLFNTVINVAAKAYGADQYFKIGQVNSNLRVKLPFLPVISDILEKSPFPPSGLFVIKGVLIACTVPTKYCKSAVYKCNLEGCPGNDGQRMYDDEIRSSVCSTCGCNTEESLQERINGDQVLTVFVHTDSFKNNFLRHQGITVCLKDDLTTDLTLGSCYNVVVNNKPPLFLGWGVERTTFEHQIRFNKGLPVVGVPRSITLLTESIQNTCSNSSWALTAALSSQLASHLYPENSFLHLKIGLLLSLASQTEEGVPVPVLAVGPDCYSLLQCVSQLSRRRVTVTGPNLCGSVSGSAGSLWLEAGPLLLATGGVCYLGDWAKFGSGHSSIAYQIISALESGKIVLTVSNNSIGSPPSLPLRAAVWTFWSGDKATSSAQAQLRTLVEVFGMPLIGDGSTDIEAVAEFRLLEAMKGDKTLDHNVVPAKDIKQYLNIVCSFKVYLTPEASRLLRNYFVASRRERPDCLPLTAIKTMTALAEAHARLCLRPCVIHEDAVFVAYLYEEAILALFGPSVMSPPANMFGSFSIDPKDPTIGEQVHCRLNRFSVWLEQYITSLLSDTSVNGSFLEE